MATNGAAGPPLDAAVSDAPGNRNTEVIMPNSLTRPVQEHSDSLPALLDVRAVASILNCSPRHIHRLADAGRLPRAIKLGALSRWSRAEIERWLAAGCPAK